MKNTTRNFSFLFDFPSAVCDRPCLNGVPECVTGQTDRADTWGKIEELEGCRERKGKDFFCVSTYLSKVPNQTEGVSRLGHYGGPSLYTHTLTTWK